jgi:hypothetical protein
MTPFSAFPSLRPALFLAALSVGVVAAPRPAVAQNACQVLTPTQVATMIGGNPFSKEIGAGQMCNWSTATGPRRLQVTVTPFSESARQEFDRMYASPKKGPMGEVRHEAGLGDRALSFTLPYGVNFEVVKGSHFVLLVYANPHVAPTAHDHDALRELAAIVVGKL